MLGKIISVVCKVIIFACYVIAGWAVMEYNKYSLAGVIFGHLYQYFRHCFIGRLVIRNNTIHQNTLDNLAEAENTQGLRKSGVFSFLFGGGVY